jgi:hypothetical protein
MSPKFIGQKIDVTTDGAIKEPQAFTWRNKEYQVEEIILSWMDWGFPQGASQHDWKNRRHRNFYRVRTGSGEVYEIYHDRGPAGESDDWYLFQQLP